MKKRSSLVKQSVKKRKKRVFIAIPEMVRRFSPGCLKVFILLSIIAIVSFVFLSIYNYLISSPYLKLQIVDIEGVDKEIRHELILMCGLNPDMSLVALNLNKLKQKMEKHPWIRKVGLERRFPHTLIVDAEKEAPTAVLIADRVYYVNRWGEVFKEVEESDDIDFPVITGVSMKRSETPEQLQSAVMIIKTLSQEKGLWSLDELSEIHVKQYGFVSLYFNNVAAEIKLKCDDLPGKMDGLRKLAKHLRKTGRIRKVTGIDLNYMDGAVVSFKKG